MAYYYLVLLYLGFGGGLLLLGIGATPKFAPLRKPVSAAALALLALVWSLSPAVGRWILSVWAPSSVTAGWLLLDMRPGLWWWVLSILVSFSAVLWVTVGEQAPPVSHRGALAIIQVTLVWLVLSSGSLLLALALWAAIDIVRFVALAVRTSGGSRPVWSALAGGMASLLLWGASLILHTQGASGLWWLMRPPLPVTIVLMLAAGMRIGFYPFQIVHAEGWGSSRVLTLANALGSFLGVALLYRLLSLPATSMVRPWLLLWGCLSVLWMGVRSLLQRGRRAVLPGAFGLLVAICVGAIVGDDPLGLALGAGVWFAAFSILAVSRGYHPRGFTWSWPTLLAVVTLVGAPPSPLLRLYYTAFRGLRWPLQVLYGLGLTLSVASLVRGTRAKATGRVGGTTSRQWLPVVAGLLVPFGMIVAVTLRFPTPPLALGPLAPWASACIAGFALALFGDRVRANAARWFSWQGGRAALELLDLQWFYRAALQGGRNLLTVVRATSEVVEGSGSVLWSLVILLLVLMAIGFR